MAAAAMSWEVVERLLSGARNKIEVLAPDPSRQDVAIRELPVDPSSTVAQVGWHVGGVLVDDGWFRLLGCGHPRMTLGLDVWNGVGSRLEPWRPGEVLVVAHDVVGGFFAVDSGALGFTRGGVAYLAPDAMQWEDMEMGYPDFLRWLADGELTGFAADHRWPGWRPEVSAMSGDDGIFLAPPLWAEGPPIDERRRAEVPMTALWTYAHATMEQLEGVPEGATVNVAAMSRPSRDEDAPSTAERRPR